MCVMLALLSLAIVTPFELAFARPWGGVDFLFFFADGPAQSPGGLFACATSSALRRRRGPAGGGKTQEPKCLSANIQPLIPHTS